MNLIIGQLLHDEMTGRRTDKCNGLTYKLWRIVYTTNTPFLKLILYKRNDIKDVLHLNLRSTVSYNYLSP